MLVTKGTSNPIPKKGSTQHVPSKGRKDNPGCEGSANSAKASEEIISVNSQRDPGSKPEEHGQGIESQERELVCHFGEEAGCEGEVDKCQEGEDAGEDAEIDARWRVTEELVCDCEDGQL